MSNGAGGMEWNEDTTFIFDFGMIVFLPSCSFVSRKSLIYFRLQCNFITKDDWVYKQKFSYNFLFSFS